MPSRIDDFAYRPVSAMIFLKASLTTTSEAFIIAFRAYDDADWPVLGDATMLLRA